MPEKKGLPLLTLLALSLFTVSLLASSAVEEESPLLKNPAMVKALSTLEKEEYKAELTWWAADERGGREPGTLGSIQAGNSAAEEFRRLGLKPVGDLVDGKPSYFQSIDEGGKQGIFPGHRLAVGDEVFTLGKDWSLLDGCPEVNLSDVDVVFAGYGITAPEYDYDDYEGVNVEGKAVLVLRYEPQEKDKDSDWRGAANTGHAYFGPKIENAKKHGAVALLFVNGPLFHDPDQDPLENLSTRTSSSAKIPMVHVRKKVANRLLKRAGLTLSGVQIAIDKKAEPASTRLPGARLDLKAKAGVLQKARNVMGLLEGSDPRLKEELLVIGAHYDHLGLGAYGSRARDRMGEVHNGADDNASGSVGVLELAEAFVQGALRPKRSILFQLYDAEEKGFCGSKYYVDHPAFPLEKTVAMINLDMIAHVQDKKCSIMGTSTAEEWEEILKLAEQGSPVIWNHSGRGRGGSDQASFLRKNIPVLFFFSGIHSAYHTPDDDVEQCNLEGAVEVMKVALQTAHLVANLEKPLTFKKEEVADRSRPRPKPPRFGVMVMPPGEGQAGIEITRLTPKAGAEKAGFRVGDILLEIGEDPVNSRDDLINVLLKYKPGDIVKVRFLRGERENHLEVSLGKS